MEVHVFQYMYDEINHSMLHDLFCYDINISITKADSIPMI